MFFIADSSDELAMMEQGNKITGSLRSETLNEPVLLTGFRYDSTIQASLQPFSKQFYSFKFTDGGVCKPWDFLKIQLHRSQLDHYYRLTGCSHSHLDEK